MIYKWYRTWYLWWLHLQIADVARVSTLYSAVSEPTKFEEDIWDTTALGLESGYS